MATSAKVKKSARTKSALKRARQTTKLNAANSALRSRYRTAVKGVRKAIQAGDQAQAAEIFKSAQGTMDKIADKRIFHKNTAARHKSRLNAAIKSMGATAAA